LCSICPSGISILKRYMKKIYLLLLLTLLTNATCLFAQCPPPGFPDAGNTCQQAPILCENLDGYCNTINNNNTTQSFPGCPNNALNNDEWFAFYAGTTSISIQVIPSNCSQSNNMGLQAGIYSNCVSGPLALQCPCTQNPFTLTSNNFVVGQIYWMVLDGCSGNVCDYTIDVVSGSTVGAAPANPGPVSGNTTVCAGTSAAYSLAAVPAATVYTWSVTPAGMGTVSGTGTNVNVNWGNTPGTAEVCVLASNACYGNPTPSCRTVEIIPRPTATLSGAGVICQGSSTPVTLTVNFTGNGPWTFTPTLNGAPQAPITTSNNPHTFTVTQAGTWGLQSVSQPPGNNCTGTVSGTAVITATNVAATATPTATNCGLSTGSVNLTPSNGTAPYTYVWSSGETTEDLSNVPGGTYTVTVTDANGCTRTATATVANNTINFTVTPTVVANTTCNGGNGSISLSVTPAGSYTFTWGGGETTSSLTGLAPGSYQVTVSAGGTCTQTPSFTINNTPNEPNATATTVQSTCDLPNGSINVNVTGGVTPYTFNWGSGQTSQNLSGQVAGPYSLTVTGANGCTDVVNVNLANNNPPINVTGNVVANTTCNGGNGSITASAAPAGAYTYAWDNGATTPAITGLTPGTYIVTVSGGGTCSNTASFNVNNNPNNPNANANTVASTCDLPNGSINVTVSGGVTPYTFNWATGQTSQNLTGQLAGPYDVTVTGANGCTDVVNVNLPNNNPPINLIPVIVNNTTCNGGNGSIALSASPAGTYTFSWGNGATTPTITGLTPGSYDVTVSAGGSCTTAASFNVNDNPNVPNPNPNPTQSTCDLANGSIGVGVTGGQLPYTFSWSTGASTQSISNLLAGTYTITVTGANGCSAVEEVIVDNDNPLFNIGQTVLPNTACNANTTGSIALVITPGGVYTYSWSTGQSTPGIGQLPAGTYTVTVSAGGTCVQIEQFDVPNEPNEPQTSFSVVDATCGQPNGSINLSVTGATLPYTYNWSSGQTVQDLNNVLPNVYFVTVTAGNGCTMVDATEIQDIPVPIGIFENVTNNSSCFFQGNGAISITTNPNNATVMWSNNSTSKNLTNLMPGDYTVTVTVGNNCTETATITVFDDSEAPVPTADVTPATCGLSNGAIDLSLAGGIGPFTYKWVLPNGTIRTTQDLNNLPGGEYELTVTSSVGCSAVTTAIVPDNPISIDLIAYIQNNEFCFSPNGAIQVDVAPETYTYTYQWSVPGNGPSLSNLNSGTYTLTVKTGTCTESATFEVENEATAPNLSVSATAATCGVNNGTATANPSGSTTPYKYKWSTNATTQGILNAAPGNYTVTVTGANGCTTTGSVTIANNNLSLAVTAQSQPNNSCVAGNGTLTTSVSPAGAYSYAWSNAATTSNLSNLAEGTYTVTVTAGPTCSQTATFAVASNTQDPVLSLTVTPAICGLSNGNIDLSTSGAVAPYTYAWSNMATTQNLTNILAGNYTVTVTAANGCTADSTLNVANNSSDFALTGAAIDLNSCATPNGSVNLTVTPSGTYTYSWSNSATTEDISNLPAGTYTVVVTKTGTCAASASYVVEDLRDYPALSQVTNAEVCGLQNGSIAVTTTGGTSPFTYSWSNSATTEDLQNQAMGTYTLLVTDNKGCTASTTATIAENAINFALSGTTATNTSCGVNNGGIDLTVTPSGTYTYTWSNSTNNQDLNAIPGGNYAVTVSAGGTCTSVATFNVDDNTLSPIISANLTPSICGASSGAIALSVSGSVAPFNYVWSLPGTTSTQGNLLAGDYAVTVTGANGCVSVDAYTVLDNVFSPSLSGVTAPNTACLGGNGNVNLSVNPPGTYTYTWLNGPSTQDLANLVAGTYSVTVSAGGACTAIGTYTVDEQFDAPTISENLTASICGQPNGAIDVNVTGGQSPYTYKWSNNATVQDLSGILSGSYSLTVTAANGCTATQVYSVPNNSNTFTISEGITPNSSCAASNGSISLNLFPIGNNYLFSWSNGKTTASVTGMAAGSYTVTVNDGSNCTASATYIIPDDIATVLLSGTNTDILCFGQNTGTISTSASGGLPPYTYAWTPLFGGDQVNPTSLSAGNYALTVRDALGCTATTAFSIVQPATGLQLACGQAQTISQPGQSDGAGKVTISGGTAPYRVDWSPGADQSNVPAGQFNITNLGEGSYQVTVTDANDCTAICGFNVGLVNCVTTVGTMSATAVTRCGPACIQVPYNATGQNLEPDDALQFILHSGNSNAIVGEIARNSQPDFCFQTGTMSYGTTYYISAVAGNNTGGGNVNLSDYCTVVAFGTPVTWREKPEVDIASPEDITCAKSSVTLTASASMTGVAYQWSSTNGQITSATTLPTATVNKQGIYRVIVAIDGCLDTAAVSVKDLRNNPVATITANPDDILDCKIDEVILTGTVSGSEDASTVWYANGVLTSSDNPFQVDAPGVYTFVLLDTLSFCADTASITIDENLAYPPLTIAPPATLTCAQPTVTLQGSSPFPNIQFRWATITGVDTSFLSNGSSVVVSTPGTYYFLGRDPVNNCRNIAPITVSADKSEPIADAGQPFSMDCFGEIKVLDGSASSGAAVLNFQWTTSGGGSIVNGQTTATPTINKPGTYVLRVINPANGCSDEDEVIISPEAPVANLLLRQAPCVGDKGSILVESVTGGAPPVRYSLNGAPLTTQNLFAGLAPGVYTLLVQDAAGCTTTRTDTLFAPLPFGVSVTPEVKIKLGDIYTLEAVIEGPASALSTVSWQPGTGLTCDTCLITDAKPLQSTYYRVYVESENGCKDNAEVRVLVDRRANIYVPNIFSPNGDNENDVFMIFADPRMVSKIQRMQIFDRWGNMLFVQENFQPNDPDFGWTGIYRGSALNPGVFVWYAEVELIDGRVELLKGDVTLQR
jgi:gliding motility-associated-like protein